MITLDNACTFLGMTAPTLRVLVRDGKIKAYKIGNAKSSKVFFQEQDLRAFIKQHTKGNCTFRGEWLSERKVCKILNICQPELERYVNAGKIACYQAGEIKGSKKLYRSTEVNKLKGELKK